MAARANLRDELDRIEVALGEIDDRDALLSRIAPDTSPDRGENAGSRASAPAAAPGEILRGPAIRRVALRVLLDQPERPEAMHYRHWYELVTQAGYSVAGKDPLAVFLTQLSRSPLVTRGTQTGVYAVDLKAPRRLRERLSGLHLQMRALASTPETTADLAAIGERRAELTAQTARAERALEEAEALLAPVQDPLRAVG